MRNFEPKLNLFRINYMIRYAPFDLFNLLLGHSSIANGHRNGEGSTDGCWIQPRDIEARWADCEDWLRGFILFFIIFSDLF